MKLMAKQPEVTRAVEALEAVQDPVPVDKVIAAIRKVGTKFSSVAKQRTSVAMFTKGSFAVNGTGAGAASGSSRTPEVTTTCCTQFLQMLLSPVTNCSTRP